MEFKHILKKVEYPFNPSIGLSSFIFWPRVFIFRKIINYGVIEDNDMTLD